MSKKSGFFLVLEGTDGSGKGTQFKLLKKRLKQEGYDVECFDFPQYEQESSFFVREYLAGKYGTAAEVGPYTGSLFFSLDRYQAAPEIKEALAAGKVVLANRYTGSSMAHQGTKFDNVEERKGYFLWLDAIEFQMLGIPRPDISLVLRVPPETAYELVGGRANSKRDIHDADLDHFKKSVAVYDNLCQLFPKDFKELDCVRNNRLMDIDNIHSLIWETVQPMLPTDKARSKDQPMVPKKTKNSYINDTGNGLEASEAGLSKLKEIVTNNTENVYAFTENLSSQTIAAAMARLSRRGDDMRITLLDEFLGETGQDEKLLQRVVTAYGDDSVQQLTGLHVVVEDASNLLTKKLEWGRLAAYLEQSTRYIYFDQKDKDGKYRFLVPKKLDKKTMSEYIKIMNQIFDNYSDMVHKLTEYVRISSKVPANEQDGAWRAATRAQACDTIRPVLPVATKTTVGIFGSAQAIESLIMHLQSEDLPEAQTTGNKILKEVRKVSKVFFERADQPNRGGAFVAYRANTRRGVKNLADKYLSDKYSTSLDPVTLSSVWPRNEIDILPDILYEHSGMSLQEIQEQIASWSYEKKLEVFESYIGERLNRRHRPGRAFEKIHYSWDLVCDYGIFRDLQRHRMVDDLEWQQLTPRYGFEVPGLVDEAGLTEQFESCFDLSLRLYSILQSAGYEIEAQYATLLGHKMRWKVTFNAREAFQMLELRTSPQGHPGYRKLAKLMHDKITETHPLIGQSMNFINKDEDPELTRLATERYSQFKLDQLG
jgi:thymidylate kinase/thymidylate synthase ThyX